MKSPIKILLVEDDEDDYVMTRDLLSEIEGSQYDLEWVSNPNEALALMATKDHDVYLIDFRLGEINGISLMRNAIGKGCKTPIILLTGQSDKEIDVEAMEAGASDYLVKGQISASMLERSIRYAIEQKKSESQIRHMAYYDHLTHLPNRFLFKDRLQLAINHGKRYSRLSALIFIDLDNFKRVNDTFGHSVGDLLLIEVANTLLQCVRQSDSVCRNVDMDSKETVARLGGDEFTILLNEIVDSHDAARVAKRILKAFTSPLFIEGNEIYTRLSMGIAIHPVDGEDTETLIKNSDAAMYHAKSQGKNNYQFYKHSMNVSSLERLTLENHLHRAIERNELLLYYQPQVDARCGKLVGVEALMRWQHPIKGMVPPVHFIPIAEETGLILPMSEWLFKTACLQNKAWQDQGFEPVPIAVNLSGQHFKNYNLVGAVRQALQDTDLEACWLELEITENIVMENMDVTLNMLKELKEMGCRLAMDDFGIGYSSFAHLKKFPLDLIKIDQSFVKDITSNADSVAIVAAIIAMSNSLGLSVIAEGVETAEQQSTLLKQGCFHTQGYLISRPLPVDAIGEFLKKNLESTLKISVASETDFPLRGL